MWNESTIQARLLCKSRFISRSLSLISTGSNVKHVIPSESNSAFTQYSVNLITFK